MLIGLVRRGCENRVLLRLDRRTVCTGGREAVHVDRTVRAEDQGRGRAAHTGNLVAGIVERDRAIGVERKLLGGESRAGVVAHGAAQDGERLAVIGRNGVRTVKGDGLLRRSVDGVDCRIFSDGKTIYIESRGGLESKGFGGCTGLASHLLDGVEGGENRYGDGIGVERERVGHNLGGGSLSHIAVHGKGGGVKRTAALSEEVADFNRILRVA